MPDLAAPPAPVAEAPQTQQAFSAIDNLFTGEPPKPNDPPQELPETTPPPPKPATPPPEVNPNDPPKPNQEPPKPQKASELRIAYEASKAEAKRLATELEDWKKKATTPPEDPEKKKWLEERESLSKSKSQLEEELRYARYESTDEFKTKYQLPFESSYKEGADLVQKFTFREAPTAGENGETVEGAARKGTIDDWNNFLQMDNDAANKFAVERFGHNAQELILARRELSKLVKDKNIAVKEYREKGAERDKLSREQAETQEKEFKTLWEQERESARKDPEKSKWFTPADGDEPAKTKLTHGEKIANLAFGDTSKMTVAERARLYGAAYNMVATFPHVIHQSAMKDARIAELESKLKDFEESEPGNNGNNRVQVNSSGQPVSGVQAVDSAIDKMAVLR